MRVFMIVIGLGRQPTLVSALSAIVLMIHSGPIFAATATGDSSRWFFKKGTDSGTASWRFSTPTASDMINWTSRPNEADGRLFSDPLITASEPKFTITAPPAPVIVVGRGFTGFSHTDTVSSSAISTGSGSSTSTPGTLFGTNYSAMWTVTATGTLGSPKPVNWKTKTIGVDPLFMTAGQFAAGGITDPTFDLFLSAGLSGGNFSPSGGINLDVTYRTATQTIEVLSIALDVTGAVVTSGLQNGLQIYRLPSLLEGPTENPTQLTSLAMLQAALEADFGPDRRMDTPLFLGLVLQDLPIPSMDLGNGAVAQIDVAVTVRDQDAAADSVPAPQLGTLGLIALGGALLGVRRLRLRLRR